MNIPGAAGGTGGTPPGADTEEAADALRRSVARQFGRSLHIRTLDTGSCAACEQEIRLLAAPHYDLHRLGFFFTPAPRHADLLMVTGPMIRAFDIAARKTYEAMPGPKLVVGDRGVRARRRLPARRVHPRHDRRDRSRWTCGSPAARPARSRCCRACWSRWTGSPRRYATSASFRTGATGESAAAHVRCRRSLGRRRARRARPAGPPGRGSALAASCPGSAAPPRWPAACPRCCPATAGSSRPADPSWSGHCSCRRPAWPECSPRCSASSRSRPRRLRPPLSPARPRDRGVPGRVQPRAAGQPGRAHLRRRGHLPRRLGDDVPARLPAHPAPPTARRGRRRRVLVPGPVRDRVRAHRRGVRDPRDQDRTQCSSTSIAARAHLVPGGWRDAAYLLALAGFGFKAGLVPLHVWLPEAHPVAPADGSAFLSGLVVKLGVYGIALFAFRLLPDGPAWRGPAHHGGRCAHRRDRDPVRAERARPQALPRVLHDREHRDHRHRVRRRR